MKKENTILVVTPFHKQYAVTWVLLSRAGFDVRFGCGTDESLRIAETECPKLVISELALPNIDGLQLCRDLRRDCSLIPILLVGDL